MHINKKTAWNILSGLFYLVALFITRAVAVATLARARDAMLVEGNADGKGLQATRVGRDGYLGIADLAG